MASGFGFMAPPSANPGFFENQPAQQPRVSPSENTAPVRMSSTNVFSSHNSIPITQQNTNEIGSDTQTALANPPRPVSPLPQPPSTSTHHSVPLTQPSGWPITPSTQQTGSRIKPVDNEEPRKLLDPIGFVRSDQPSIPVHYEPHRPLVPTSDPGVPLGVKTPQVSMPKVGLTRDTSHATVPVHEPNLAPIMPTGPEKPIWVEYPGLIRGPQSDQPTEPKPTGTPSMPITHPAQRPILRPNEPMKPIWMEYRNEQPAPSNEGPVNALARDMSSVKLHDLRSQPILPPRDSLKPIWLDYSNRNRNPEPTTEDRSNDQPSVPIAQPISGPVQPPSGLVKPFWIEYPDAGSRPSGVQPSFVSSSDTPSASLDRQSLPIMPRGDASKPSWSGLMQARRPPPGLVTSLAKDRPSVKIGPDPPKKMSSDKQKTEKDTWKPVKPMIRGDSPSVPIGPQITEKPPEIEQPAPLQQRVEPKQQEHREVITLYPEDKEVVKLYREDPSQERELWIHTKDMEKTRDPKKGPYVTKLVVSDNGKIPLSALQQPSSCRGSYEQQTGEQNSIYKAYVSSGDRLAANYVPQCT